MKETMSQVKKRIALSNKRREWINNEFAQKTRGTHMLNSKKSRLLKKLWRIAKRKFR